MSTTTKIKTENLKEPVAKQNDDLKDAIDLLKFVFKQDSMVFDHIQLGKQNNMDKVLNMRKDLFDSAIKKIEQLELS